MGMYDHVDVYVPLPDGSDTSGRGFQSKDFGCHMDTIKITSAGRLVFEECHYEDVPLDERPFPRAGGLLGLMGCMRRVYDRDVDMNYHGDVEFYDRETRYVARFTDGSLARITATKWSDE